MKWHVFKGKYTGRWNANGLIYKTFDTWQAAMDWIDTQRHQEPSG